MRRRPQRASAEKHQVGQQVARQWVAGIEMRTYGLVALALGAVCLVGLADQSDGVRHWEAARCRGDCLGTHPMLLVLLLVRSGSTMRVCKMMGACCAL
jgi:hypothetical protein